MSLPVPIQWAQRPENVLITIPITDAKDATVKVENDVLHVACKSGDKVFDTKLQLFAEVVPDESSNIIRDRCIEVKLAKKDKSAEYWPRLTQAKVKNPHIGIDWARWKDEDEVDAKEDLGDFGGMGGMGGGMGGMDMQQMLANMGGMGGMGGAGGVPDFGQGGADSDDEEEEVPPPLE